MRLPPAGGSPAKHPTTGFRLFCPCPPPVPLVLPARTELYGRAPLQELFISADMDQEDSMNKTDVIRAWKDPFYRASLSEEAQAALPQHPAGITELSEEQLTT